MYNLEFGTFMFKFNNNFLSNAFEDLFSLNSLDIHVINTRNKSQIQVTFDEKGIL